MNWVWPERLAYTVDEAVFASGVGRRKLYQEMAAGKLQFSMAGGRRRIMKRDLEDWLSGGRRA